MSHRLEPFEGRPFLDPDEIVARLRDEFTYVEADRDEGDSIVGDIIAKLIELNAPQEVKDQQVTAQSRSIAVVVADDSTSDDCLQFTVKPEEGILIGYASAQQEAAARPNLERCANVLNYSIELI